MGIQILLESMAGARAAEVEIELSDLRIVNGLVTQGGAQTVGDCHSADRVRLPVTNAAQSR